MCTKRGWVNCCPHKLFIMSGTGLVLGYRQGLLHVGYRGEGRQGKSKGWRLG